MKSRVLKFSLSLSAILFIFSFLHLNESPLDREQADEVWPEVNSYKDGEFNRISL